MSSREHDLPGLGDQQAQQLVRLLLNLDGPPGLEQLLRLGVQLEEPEPKDHRQYRVASRRPVQPIPRHNSLRPTRVIASYTDPTRAKRAQSGKRRDLAYLDAKPLRGAHMHLMNDDRHFPSTRPARRGCIRSTWRLPREHRCRCSSARRRNSPSRWPSRLRSGRRATAPTAWSWSTPPTTTISSSTLMRAAGAPLSRLRAVVVHDVDVLDQAQQSALMPLVRPAPARPAASSRPRRCRCSSGCSRARSTRTCSTR